ncbi:hypothetical protein SEPCBS119000_006573, partial [Sporothrix epigloea]
MKLFWLEDVKLPEAKDSSSRQNKHKNTTENELEDSPEKKDRTDQHTRTETLIKRQHTDGNVQLSAYTWPNPQWLLNRRKNELSSKFYGFPSELLLHIFGEADFLTQLMLRSTCSRFAELITSLDVKRYQGPNAPRLAYLNTWPLHGTEEQRLAVQKQLSTLVRRDRPDLCKECEAFEQSGQLDEAIRKLRKILWCSYCERYHDRGMFSFAQRKQWSTLRMCIGWEGRLRLCPHISYSWAQVEARKRRSELQRQHGKFSMVLLICPQGCHWSGSYNSFGTKEDSFEAKEAAPWKLVNRVYLGALKHGPKPVPELAGTWANHVFDIDPDRPLTRHTFREALEKLDTSKHGPHLCPH